jgi:outer membrane protein OmpA-like peptidoglycan-associated protein
VNDVTLYKSYVIHSLPPVLNFTHILLINKKMKILIIGFMAFFAWSSMASYIYVCKIKGFCNVPVAQKINTEKDKDAIDNNTVLLPATKGKATIPGNLMIYYAYDKSELDSDAGTERYFVESNKYLATNPNASICITGHTDAIGSDKYNKALGYKRAQSMQDYFESRGMPANKIKIESKGEIEPLVDNATSVGRATNRRTSIIIKN